jgi:murein DD-endopeptidase MepM/ murein hydrolase activator NlpD
MRRSLLSLLACLLLCSVTTGTAWAGEATGNTGPDPVAVHVVQHGETIESIASRYSISEDRLRSANGLSAGQLAEVGQHLYIPPNPGDYPAAASATVVVGLSDSLEALATRYGSSPEELAALNHVVNPRLLLAGQVIGLPSGRRASNTVELIAPGRDIRRIALAHNAVLSSVLLANRLASPYGLATGRSVIVPGGVQTGSAPPAPAVVMSLRPLPLVQGRASALHVQTSGVVAVRVMFLGREWPVGSDGDQHTALLPVDRWTAPGSYPLTVTYQDSLGVIHTDTREVIVAEGRFAAEQIRLAESIAAVLDDEQQTQSELTYVLAAVSGFTPRQWEGLFVQPVAGVLTSGFGTLRSYNGRGFRSYHSGADLAAPSGTPIFAPAAGTVVATASLAVRGNATILDHGWGVYTGYWHQARILVQEGDVVVAGQQIGTVGSTGLSTAAHLHWEMWVNGVRVDPMPWVRTPFR